MPGSRIRLSSGNPAATARAILDSKKPHHVVPVLMEMRYLWLAHAVHDEEGGAVLGTQAGVSLIRQGSHIVQQLNLPGRKNPCGNFRAPGIGRQDRWPDLLPIAWGNGGPDFFPALEKPLEASQFLRWRNCSPVCPRAFRTDINDVSARHDLRPGLGHSSVEIQASIARKGIIVHIDDAHHQRSLGEGNGSLGQPQQHGFFIVPETETGRR